VSLLHCHLHFNGCFLYESWLARFFPHCAREPFWDKFISKVTSFVLCFITSSSSVRRSAVNEGSPFNLLLTHLFTSGMDVFQAIFPS